MKELSNVVTSIPESKIRTVFNRAMGHDDWLKFTFGEPDFDTPMEAIEAANNAALSGHTKYVHQAGILPLRHAISKKFDIEIGLKSNPETEIMVGNGGQGILQLALKVLVNPGDEVIMADKSWPPYPFQTLLLHGKPVYVPVYEEDGFMFTVENLEKAITEKTKVIMLNSPSNPTGGVASYNLLKAIAELAISKDLYVISDEVYDRIVFDDVKHYSIATIPGMRERTILVNSFSKTYAMTGWRIGYGFACEKIMKEMSNINEIGTSCTNPMAQYGALEMLNSGEPYLQKMVLEYSKRRRIIIDGINSIKGITCVEPKGTFYIFPNIEKTGLSSDDFCNRLMDEVGVVTVPGNSFGDGGEGFIRMSFATSEEIITEGLNRMESFVKRL